MNARLRAALIVLASLALAACTAPSAPRDSAPAASMASKAPPIESWRTGNGARVMYVASPSLPILDLRVVFDAGSARDGASQGLAALSNSLLDNGAAGMDADTIAGRLEGVGARLSLGSERDMAYLSLRTLSRQPERGEALEVFEAVLHRPEFPQAEVERLKRQMLIGIRSSQQDPGEVASKAFYQALYGVHPYASPPEGTEETVPALTRAQVLEFHQRYYVAGNAVIAIVGDLDRSDAERLAERLAAGLPAGAAAPALPAVPRLEGSRRVHIPFPSEQSHLLMGSVGMRRGDPDYFTLYVANHSFGGSGFNSRLVEEIREKRGLAYSAYSFLLPMAGHGPFQMGLQTRNDQLELASAVMEAEFRKFVAGGLSEAELEASRRNITGGAPLRVDSNSKLLGYLAMIGFYDLPLDYLQTFNQRIDAVDRAGIASTLKRRFDPDAMITVVVGGKARTADAGG